MKAKNKMATKTETKMGNIIQLDLTMEASLLKACKSLVAKFPLGRLKCAKVDGKTYYYLKRPSDEKYIPVRKGDRKLVALAWALCKRKWLETMIRILECNIRSEKRLQKKYRAYDFDAINEMVSDAYKFMDEKQWYTMLGSEVFSDKVIQSENPSYREDLIHCTSFGLRVRSKSEQFIAEMLHAAGIPFRYEPEIKLTAPDGMIQSYYPDFLLKHPMGGTLYWEHIGMLGDEEYLKRNKPKYLAYFHNHITPGINLIITCDDVDGAPSVPMFGEIIKWLLANQKHY